MIIPEEFNYITEDMLQPFGYMPEGLPRILPPFGKFKQWKIADQWTYIDPTGILIQEYEDALTDLASVPQPFRMILDVPGRETAGAVAHDNIYRHPLRPRWNILTKQYQLLSKSDGDRIFDTINTMGCTYVVKRKCLNFGLDVGGWYGWNKGMKSNPCTLPMSVLPLRNRI